MVTRLRGAQPVRHVYAATRASRTGVAVVTAALQALVTAAAGVGAHRPVGAGDGLRRG